MDVLDKRQNNSLGKQQSKQNKKLVLHTTKDAQNIANTNSDKKQMLDISKVTQNQSNTVQEQASQNSLGGNALLELAKELRGRLFKRNKSETARANKQVSEAKDKGKQQMDNKNYSIGR